MAKQNQVNAAELFAGLPVLAGGTPNLRGAVIDGYVVVVADATATGVPSKSGASQTVAKGSPWGSRLDATTYAIVTVQKREPKAAAAADPAAFAPRKG